MKAILALAFVVATWPTAWANTYAIVWSSIEGGGGGSSGGPFAISGGIGKMESPAAGGGFAAAGGFWSVVAIQEPGTPRLYIALQSHDGMVRVFWPSRFSMHLLQQSADLSAGSWSTSPHPVTNDGVNRSITILPAPGRQFFRLSGPPDEAAP